MFCKIVLCRGAVAIVLKTASSKQFRLPVVETRKNEKDSLSENEFYLLRALDANSEVSQRQLAQSMGISLGSINYCLNALVNKGCVKVENFISNPKKSGYMYLLTPKGVREKSKLTVAFLERKQKEYVRLQYEIKQLQDELNGNQ